MAAGNDLQFGPSFMRRSGRQPSGTFPSKLGSSTSSLDPTPSTAPAPAAPSLGAFSPPSITHGPTNGRGMSFSAVAAGDRDDLRRPVPPSSTAVNGHGAAPGSESRKRPVEYSRETLLSLYSEERALEKPPALDHVEPGAGSAISEHLVGPPLGLVEMSELEKELFSGPFNSDRRSNKQQQQHNPTSQQPPHSQAHANGDGVGLLAANGPRLSKRSSTDRFGIQGGVLSGVGAPGASPVTTRRRGESESESFETGDRRLPRPDDTGTWASARANRTRETGGGAAEGWGSKWKRDGDNVPRYSVLDRMRERERANAAREDLQEVAQESDDPLASEVGDLSLDHASATDPSLRQTSASPVSTRHEHLPSEPSSVASHLPAPQPPQSSQPVESIPWQYRDPSGTVQGPFTAFQMQEWYKASFFRDDLLVKRQADGAFETLETLILRVGDRERPFLTRPPPALPPNLPHPQQHAQPPPPQQQPQHQGQGVQYSNQLLEQQSRQLDHNGRPAAVPSRSFLDRNPMFSAGEDGIFAEQQQQHRQPQQPVPDPWSPAGQQPASPWDHHAQIPHHLARHAPGPPPYGHQQDPFRFPQSAPEQQRPGPVYPGQQHPQFPGGNLFGMPSPSIGRDSAFGGVSPMHQQPPQPQQGAFDPSPFGPGPPGPPNDPAILYQHQQQAHFQHQSHHQAPHLPPQEQVHHQAPQAQRPTTFEDPWGEKRTLAGLEDDVVPPSPIAGFTSAPGPTTTDSPVRRDSYTSRIIAPIGPARGTSGKSTPVQAESPKAVVTELEPPAPVQAPPAAPAAPAPAPAPVAAPSVPASLPTKPTSPPVDKKASPAPGPPTPVPSSLPNKPVTEVKSSSAGGTKSSKAQEEAHRRAASIARAQQLLKDAQEQERAAKEEAAAARAAAAAAAAAATPSTPTVAPWSTAAEEKKSAGPSLAEIQAIEAKQSERRKAAEKQAIANRLAAEQSAAAGRAAKEARETLPTSATWATGQAGQQGQATPGRPSSSPVQAWNKDLATDGAKPSLSMKQIQEEEAKRKKATQQVAANRALPGRGGYAGSVTPTAAKPSPPAASAAGAAWSVVGGNKPKVTAPPQANGRLPGAIPGLPGVPRTTAAPLSAAPPPSLPRPPTQPRAVSIPAKPAAPNPDAPPAASPDFLKWLRDALRGMNNVDDFIKMLLDFPVDPDESVLEIISDSVYAGSATLDGRRFAKEFKERRIQDAGSKGKAAQQPQATAAPTAKKPTSMAEAVKAPVQAPPSAFNIVQKKSKRR